MRIRIPYRFPGIRAVRNFKDRIFFGWWILTLGCLIVSVGVGILYHSFTVFFLPLKREFGVSSAAIALLFSAARLEGGIEGPFVGYLIDRFGPRTMIFIGAAMAGLGLLILATVNDYWTFFIIYILIVSLGSNAGFGHPVTTVINHWFIRHRGIAFSCLSASMSVGGMITAPILSYVIITFGWRTGAVTAGLILLTVALPAAFRIHRSPEEVGLHPDGRPLPSAPLCDSAPNADSIGTIDFTVHEALRTATYWMLLVTISLRLFVMVALNTHFVPILVWRGLDELTSAYLVSLFGSTSIVAALIMGWMGDRWGKKKVCALGTVPNVLALIWLTLSPDPLALYFFPIALAIANATAPLSWALIGDFFGRSSYATLRGIMGVGYGAATFISPIYGGWIYDQTGSYAWALLSFAVIHLLVFFLFLALRQPFAPHHRT